jgi:hypothetical protein
LNHLTKSLSELSKVVSYSTLLKLFEDSDKMQTIDIDFICFQNRSLQENRSKAMKQVLERLDTEQPKTERSTKAAKELIQIMKGMCKFEQDVIAWLINIKLDPSINESRQSEPMQKLSDLCSKDQSLWLVEVNFSIDSYLDTKKIIDKMQAYIGTTEDNQSPDKEIKSLLPVIEQLISMLKVSKTNKHEHDLLQIWNLALRSLRTVDVS